MTARLKAGVMAQTYAGICDLSGMAVNVLLSNAQHCWVEVVGHGAPTLTYFQKPSSLLLLVAPSDLEMH